MVQSNTMSAIYKIGNKLTTAASTSKMCEVLVSLLSFAKIEPTTDTCAMSMQNINHHSSNQILEVGLEKISIDSDYS